MCAESLIVRSYNVNFGDALLVTVPDRDANGTTTDRHILIDVGNVLSGEGSDDDVFVPIIEDVLDVTNGNPVDLYVMTHEHMDHVQGLLAASRTGLVVRADYVWCTASSAPDYYDHHPDARKKFELARRAFLGLERQLMAAPDDVRQRLRARMLNNDFRRTADCIEYIRTQVCPAENLHFVHREFDLEGAHPFVEARFELWAPEEDTSGYYGRFQPLALGLTEFDGDDYDAPPGIRPAPPGGVDVGAFQNLLDRREAGGYDNLLAIDKARNNTSIVFSLEWRGWRLLFAGDAELRSWKTMQREGVIKPVHFLKVAHHGSHNGTPTGDILDALLPEIRPDGDERVALVSSCDDTYAGVPHSPTLSLLAERCTIVDTREVAPTESYDIEFVG